MSLILALLLIIILLLAIGWWWRYRSLACPVNFTFLLENRFMNSVAGPDKILHRIKLAPGMRLLDVGAGPGRLTLPAARRVGSSGEVVALDIQEGMLEKLRLRAAEMGIDNVRSIHAAAGSGVVEKDFFDRAILVTVLGEIRNPQAALLEIFDALKEGGILSVTEVIPDPHYTSRSRVRALCRQAGFKEIGLFGGWSAFTINFEKPLAEKG